MHSKSNSISHPPSAQQNAIKFPIKESFVVEQKYKKIIQFK